MKLHLRDRNAAVVDAWRRQFSGLDNVEVTQGDIFDVNADAVVSPANSFGFMDGGIDLVYSKRFGWDLQKRLQALLRAEHAGELPVGQAVLVETYSSEVPWLISAPTMRVPMDISGTANAFLALRAALLAARRHAGEPRIQTILCPGLGTAIGRMPPERAARQMAHAWAVVELGQTMSPRLLGEAQEAHAWLVR
jgi:O-acetyl-ADP-ribose deacetylase (regulator of RNase III)